MNQILSTASLCAFFLLPLAVLYIRATRPQVMPWRIAFTVVALGGWLLVIGIVEFRFAALADELRACNEHPTQELARRFAQDSGRPFARLFGWSYALIYSIPCLLLYAITQLVRHALNRNT